MVGVAFGVYYFLNKSNSVKLTTKEITIGIGDIVPDDVKSYTSSISGNSSVCSVDNKNVDTTKIGEYKVTIKCKDKTYLTGYAFESWHYRYLGKEMAKKVYDENITYDEYYTFYLDNE